MFSSVEAGTHQWTGQLQRQVQPRRAALAALVWIAAALPAALRWQQCGFVRMFHIPCPGCGMTRAVTLLMAGDWRGSLHMHPLALPVLAAGATFALATVWTTYVYGWPMVHKSRLGRASLVGLGVAYAASIILWALRWLGCFGGPVSVY
jgi:Protein of unknown function (DUF2752)